MKKLTKILNPLLVVFLLSTQLIFLFAQGNFQTKQISLGSKTNSDISSQREKNYVPGEVLVKFKPTKINLKSAGGNNLLNTFGINNNLETIDTIKNNNIAVFKIEQNTDLNQKLIELNSNQNVEYAEPNYIYKTMAASFNDPYTGYLRALPKINRYEAYELFSGNVVATGTIVAVIDAGVAYNHPDLATNMWNGSSCKDNAGGTLNNCMHGYDFADEDLNPFPVRSDHGTHVAGTIAAAANNGSGVIGINPHAQIMAIRVGDDSMTLENIIKGIDFARYNGAKIINASFGGDSYSTGMKDAIQSFGTAGGLFIAAASNSSTNHDTTSHIYPCDYTLDNIICVAATDSDDGLSSFSDYGAISVDVGAPGNNIYSTVFTKVISTGLRDDFESYATGEIPTGRVTGGTKNNRGVLNAGGARGKVLYSDIAYTYTGNADSYIETGEDLSIYSGATISFWTWCDTEYTTSDWADYMSLWITTGANYTGLNLLELGYNSWDEAMLDDDTDPDNNEGGGTYMELSADIPGSYLNSNFKVMFGWTTNGSDNEYGGCLVDDVKIQGYNPSGSSEVYGYKNGTSMATPHVAGLASLARSSRPSLTYSQIRNIIIYSGDAISSLSGKTVSGKRINAQKTLQALGYSTGSSSDTGIAWAQIYSLIGQTLSGQGIQNNLNTVTTGNVSNFSGLYFAKMSGSNELGRIIFATGLDLTDTGTQNFLSGDLPTAIGMSPGQIWFNPGTGFIGKNATLKMNLSYSFLSILNTINSGSFIVREGSGGAITGNSMITSVYSGACVGTGNYACPLYLNIAHFTQFDLKPALLQVNIKSNNSNTGYAKSGDIVTLSWTGSEILTGLSVLINGLTGVITGGGASRYSTFNVTGGTAETGITFVINYQDLDANTGNIVTTTTDSSSVRVDNTSPILSGAASVANTTTQTPSYAFTSNETGIITYSGGCTSATTTAISGTNNITFSTMSNATYSGCKIYVADIVSNQSYIVVPTFTVNYTAPPGGGTPPPTTTSNPDLDNFYLSSDDTSPDVDQQVDLTIKARKSNNNILTGYDGRVDFTIYYKSSSSSSRTETTSSNYYEIDSDYNYHHDFLLSNSGQVTLNNFIRFKKNNYEYKILVKDIEENVSAYKIFTVGGSIDTCNLSQLVCVDGVYELDDGEECEGGKLGDDCSDLPGNNGSGSIVGSPFSKDLNQAYQYAYQNGITTMLTIQKANMTGTLQRSHLAKMIVNYASKILNKQIDTSKTCTFGDIASQNFEMRGYIKAACQMGLMGVGINSFYPKNKVTRAEFGTILSRALRGNGNDQSGGNYYERHLKALKYNGIMTKIDTPLSIEIRGYVMLMLMRAEDKQ